MPEDFDEPTRSRLLAVLADAELNSAALDASPKLTPEQIATGRRAYRDLIDAVRGALHNLGPTDVRPS